MIIFIFLNIKMFSPQILSSVYKKIFDDSQDNSKDPFMAIPKDLIIHMALDYNLNDILSLCLTNKRFNQVICNNKNFWINKLIRDFDIKVNDIPKDKTPKEYYKFVIDKVRANLGDTYFLLLNSVINGELNLIKIALSRGANIHAENDEALRVASDYGHLEVVKYLVEKGANIHAEDDLPLTRASLFGHLEVVKYLVGMGANIHANDDLALKSARKNRHFKVVKYLKSLP